MAELSDKARNRYVVPETQKMRGAAIALNSEAVNIVVPTVGVSLNTVTTSLRNLLGLNWHRTISGEFSIRNDKLWLRLRMDGVSFYASKAGASVENPDDLLEDASHAIFAQIHPYFAAATEKDPQAAIKIAQQAIAHLPKTDETVVWCYILLGDLYGQVSDFSNARTALGTAGQLADKDADVHFFAGLIFGKQRNNDDAITEYNKTLDLNSHLAGAFNNRGYAYSIKNDTDRAIADYGEAIKIDPKFALALVNRGNIYYYTKKDFDKAFRDYNEAVEAAPTNPSALNGRGNVYYEKEDYVRALADYDVAIKLDPKLAAAFNGRGNVYLARKDYDNALANYNEAIRLDPTDTMAATKRASIAAFKKVDNHAPTDFSAAIKSDRDSASVYVNRASIYETSTTTTLYERSTTTTPRSTSAPSL
jgi:tetratricopeptide (TPR) repeat protein